MSEALCGATMTVATGAGVTVRVAVPIFVSLVAVTVVVPALTPVTTPVLAFIVATDVDPIDHVTVRPDRVLPFAALVIAARGIVRCSTTDGFDGEIVTVATGIGITLMLVLPVCPSLVPIMLTAPGATAVTTPLTLSTVAMLALLDFHLTVRPDST